LRNLAKSLNGKSCVGNDDCESSKCYYLPISVPGFASAAFCLPDVVVSNTRREANTSIIMPVGNGWSMKLYSKFSKFLNRFSKLCEIFLTFIIYFFKLSYLFLNMLIFKIISRKVDIILNFWKPGSWACKHNFR
jgi:hypothetical protein